MRARRSLRARRPSVWERIFTIEAPPDSWEPEAMFKYGLVPAARVVVDEGMAWAFGRGPTPQELGARPTDPVLIIDYLELPSYRTGTGWGSRFVRTAERWAREQGAVASALYSAQTANAEVHSRGFWEALGYRAVPGLQDASAGGMDAIMVKRFR